MNEVKSDVERQVARIIELIQNKKGEDIVVLDIRKVTSIADYFILATGMSNTQVKAIADEISTRLKEDDGISPWHIEGYEALTWVLIDYVDIVVHIFDPETRNYYAIEKLWKDAETRRIETSY